MIELTEGQELTLTAADGTPLTKVQMALGWDHSPTAGFIGSGAAPIDLDASAVQFAGGQFFDLAFFNHLATRDGSVVHLGALASIVRVTVVRSVNSNAPMSQIASRGTYR